MSTVSDCLTVRGINVDVVYKDIKNLHIGVYPPVGRVRVAAPTRLEEEHVRLAVVQRLPWIERRRKQLQDAARQSSREMVSGESHVELDSDRLLLYVPESVDTKARLKLLLDWQRAQLRAAIPALIERWEPAVGRTVRHWDIRRMKTMWGSCNRETARISFNLELAKKYPRCLEYVVVHEMTHLVERHHGERFTRLMDGFLSDWRIRRDELNAAPLADERWVVADEPPTTLSVL
jgi:predicted metal-dependent hydrolase